MITFFSADNIVYAVASSSQLDQNSLDKLSYLFSGARPLSTLTLPGAYIGPRQTMVTPWSTNAVEICDIIGLNEVTRIEYYESTETFVGEHDRMLQQHYDGLGQHIFDAKDAPQEVLTITDIAAYNTQEGLSLSAEEVNYLQSLSNKIGRPLTDSEVFGFSQVNSEHCRHKIFNGEFVIDGKSQAHSPFQLIKATAKQNPNSIVSAYKDNVAFIKGPQAQSLIASATSGSIYEIIPQDTVLSLKAETHNFPTTVEPFNGAATGSGGEIRDRLAGGRGSVPLAGTAVYMTSYSRLNDTKSWEQNIKARKWLYQSPQEILIKASNGASDFGNKFGQPLICGSLFCFEHQADDELIAYDKVIMQAGGIGYGLAAQAQKNTPEAGDKIVLLGGDNYRIGMGGAAVSSADTGSFESNLELNAVQRSNPEMQKRVAKAIIAMLNSDPNPIVSIHDHGAGGHLNCFSELVEDCGGVIYLDQLPLGDPTLSYKEMIGNESQERMGLIVKAKDIERVKSIATRERCPCYVVGTVTGDHTFSFQTTDGRAKPIDLHIDDLFGNSPTTVMKDNSVNQKRSAIHYQESFIDQYLRQVLQLESVACKDWLTNKVDRCVGGRIVMQQTVGPIQLPLNNCGITALDFQNKKGIATSIGHAPASSLIQASAGVRNAVAEALTNIIWAPLEDGIRSVSLSANWMWPCKHEGEDARLYEAVEAISEFAIALGINIPTGKDSLSMTQKYDKQTVKAPGTVIVSAIGQCTDFTQAISPLIDPAAGPIVYVDLSRTVFQLGGSAWAQTQSQLGDICPDIMDPSYFARAFNRIQEAISLGYVAAGHDISAGGMIVCLLEMCFSDMDCGLSLDLSAVETPSSVHLLFAENAGVILQATDDQLSQHLQSHNIAHYVIGTPSTERKLTVQYNDQNFEWAIDELRDIWYSTSFQMDKLQTQTDHAQQRYQNYKIQPLEYLFPSFPYGTPTNHAAAKRPKAGVLREKGSNSEYEMANALWQSGFEVVDIHMTDIISGRQDLSDIQLLAAVGGFSNSDVLGSAKGWAAAFRYNDNANRALQEFFKRPDTLSVGICNGCQLFMELDLIYPLYSDPAKMTHNLSGKHECQFTSVVIEDTKAIMLQGLQGLKLGVWISHGEGRFVLPQDEQSYDIAAKYCYSSYPGNPNGSDYDAAMVVSMDGRHLATMPHIERSLYAHNWAHYPKSRRQDWFSPWILAFENAYQWLMNQ